MSKNVHIPLLLGALVLLFSSQAWAQLSTRHYLPPIPTHHVSDIELQISTPADIPVAYTVRSATGSLVSSGITIAPISGTVSRGSPVKHQFIRRGQNANASGGLGRSTSLAPVPLDEYGLIIEADHAIRVIQASYHIHNRSILSSKGYNGVGRNFRAWSAANVDGVSGNPNDDSAHFISIMALEDATEVVIDSSVLFEGFDVVHDNPVLLNRFQTFTVVAKGNTSLTNAAVTATKSITVSSGDVHTGQIGRYERDGGADQLVPVEFAGTHYVVGNMGTSLTYGKAGANGELLGNRYVQLVALHDNTDVYHESNDGSLHEVYSLPNEGDIALVHLPGSQSAVHFFTTKGTTPKAFQVFLNSSGDNGGEMGGAVIPALRGSSTDGWFCSGADYVELVTPADTTHFMVYIPTADLSSLELDIGSGFVSYNDPSLLSPSVTQADADGSGPIEAVSILVFPQGLTATDDLISFRSAHRMHVSVGTAVPNRTGSMAYFSDFHYGFLIHDPVFALPTDAYEIGEVVLDPTPRKVRHCIDVESACSQRFSIKTIESDSGGLLENVDTSSSVDGQHPCFEFTPQVTSTGLPVTLKVLLEDEHGDTRPVDIKLPFSWIDFDGDGIPNTVDLDDDNDGIEDAIEMGGIDLSIDTDNDDIPDYIDVDQQACTSSDGERCDILNAIYDLDLDGIPNHLDLDSDEDGIFDLIESNDSDADGRADRDIGSDGQIATLEDMNNDGLHDLFAQVPPALTDTDADGAPDFLDADDDGDGLATRHECEPLPSTEPLDTDGDNVPNYLDSDDDGDGALTKDEQADPNLDASPSDAINSSDGDWPDVADYLDPYSYQGADYDQDGIANIDDLDDDNDGIIDAKEGPGDFDQDGVPNQYDIDSDNDSIPDLYELGKQHLDTDGDGRADRQFDLDGNGQADALAGTLTLIDTDADGLPDYRDLDSDNDSLTDIQEAGSLDINRDGLVDNLADTDRDGLVDEYDVHAGGKLPSLPDSDNDGIRDFQDPDSNEADASAGADEEPRGTQAEPNDSFVFDIEKASECDNEYSQDSVVCVEENEPGPVPNNESEEELKSDLPTLLGGGFGCSASSQAQPSPMSFWSLLLLGFTLLYRHKKKAGLKK